MNSTRLLRFSSSRLARGSDGWKEIHGASLLQEACVLNRNYVPATWSVLLPFFQFGFGAEMLSVDHYCHAVLSRPFNMTQSPGQIVGVLWRTLQIQPWYTVYYCTFKISVFFFQGILQDPTLLEMFLFFPMILLEIPFSEDACHHRKKSSHDKSAKLNWGAIPIKIKKQEIFLLPLDVIVLSLLSLENSKFHKTPPIYSPSCTIP